MYGFDQVLGATRSLNNWKQTTLQHKNASTILKHAYAKAVVKPQKVDLCIGASPLSSAFIGAQLVRVDS